MKKSAIMQIIRAKETANSIRLSDECEDLIGQFLDLERELEQKLKAHPELLEFYDKLSEASANMLTTETKELYVQGFKDGLLTGIETLLD